VSNINSLVAACCNGVAEIERPALRAVCARVIGDTMQKLLGLWSVAGKWADVPRLLAGRCSTLEVVRCAAKV